MLFAQARQESIELCYKCDSKKTIKFNEIMLNGCWIARDEIIKKDNTFFLAVSTHIAELAEVKEAELVKL